MCYDKYIKLLSDRYGELGTCLKSTNDGKKVSFSISLKENSDRFGILSIANDGKKISSVWLISCTQKSKFAKKIYI